MRATPRSLVVRATDPATHAARVRANRKAAA